MIDNAFVVFNNHVYRQVIGIPMGTNSGPHVANIYLHQYEHEYFRLLFDRGKNDLLARLKFVFRFQDDLISFNDHGLLQDSLCEIYPSVMIVNNTKFYFSLYDKHNHYDFDVISFPFLDGNIPKGQSYGVFISQLVRYARINKFKNLSSKILTLLPCESVFRHLSIIILMFGVSLGLLCQLVLYFSITYFFSFNPVTVSGFFKLFFTFF